MSDIVRELLKLQDQEGWLPPDRLEALAAELRVPLHQLESVSSFYTHLRREAEGGVEVGVCRDLSCRLAGSEAACRALRKRAAGDAAKSDPMVVREVSCLGRCDRAPAAAIGGVIVDASDPAMVERQAVAPPRESAPRAVRGWPAADPYAGETGSVESARRTKSGEARDGDAYRVLRAALAGSRTAPVETLEAAGLCGQGGAGFPTARKWSLVAAEAADSKHVVCNADESEPGTFKDRELIHDLPHLVIEAMAIAAWCVGAECGTVFIRHEYEPERRRLDAAIAHARACGALGDGIFGSDFGFDVDVFVSPGGYVLGEETALLECMEGRRGEPRNKPPFPGQIGLDGRPTLINNVETLVHALGIVAHGAEWWHGLGRDGFSGHKFISVSGDVAEPGVGLFAVGTPLAEVLERHGGMRGGAAVAAVAPGGASSNWLGPEALDLPLDFDALAEAGTMLGSGAAVFVAEGRDLLDVALSITRFFRNESCGKCVPCRVGSEKAVALIEKAGFVSAEHEALLRSLHHTMQQTSLCGLGQVALAPLLSILSRFPDGVRRVPAD